MIVQLTCDALRLSFPQIDVHTHLPGCRVRTSFLMPYCLFAGDPYIYFYIGRSNGYLAVGGSKGQLSLVDLQKWQIMEQITSSSLDLINNGLCIQSVHGQLKLFVTNNDCLLRIYSLPSLELGQTIEFQSPINTGMYICMFPSPPYIYIDIYIRTHACTRMEIKSCCFVNSHLEPRSVQTGAKW